MRSLFRSLLCLALIHFSSAVLFGEDIPLRDWPIPDSLQKEGGGPAGTGFVAIQPCRVVDTRPSQGFPAAWGPPILAANATRDFDINSAPHCPGIPTGVHAYSLNFTITEPVGAGDLRAWPQGSPPATPTSILNWPAAGVTIANATMLSANFGNGIITVQVAGSAAHLIIDINGYTTQNYNAGEQFLAIGNVGAGPVVLASNASASAGSSGVGGFVSSGGSVYGVLGQASFMSGAQSAGVAGRNTAIGSTARYGVLGTTTSTANNAAGVKGIGGSGEAIGAGVSGSPGVIGTSANDSGVCGLSNDRGTIGILFSGAGSFLVEGDLALAGATNYGVFSFGAYGGTGGKFFVDPHPTDASQVIRYVSLEGPESGTYFRGRARFERGLARIEVPDHFRMVTDREGLTVQITPIGEMTSVAVVKADLTEILVKGSRNVEFYYAVNGVRRAFKDLQPVGPGSEYMPRYATEPMPAYLSAVQKEMLISNGTYKPDGTVNMETAKRLGWDKTWEKREAARSK